MHCSLNQIGLYFERIFAQKLGPNSERRILYLTRIKPFPTFADYCKKSSNISVGVKNCEGHILELNQL